MTKGKGHKSKKYKQYYGTDYKPKEKKHEKNTT